MTTMMKKTLENILLAIKSFSNQQETIKTLSKRVEELEGMVLILENNFKILNDDIIMHQSNIERLYEINIKILSALKQNKAKSLFDDNKQLKENIN
jgi:hypothetical protein